MLISCCFFLTLFMHLFYPTVTVLLEYFNLGIYSCLGFCNSIAVNAISFKPQKVCAMMVDLYVY